ANQVLTKFHRRRVIRAGAVAATVLMFVAGSVMLLPWHHEIPREYARDDRGAVRTPSLSDQIAYQEQVIDRMLAAEKRARSEAKLVEIDLPNDDRPIERAAAQVIYAADQTARSPNVPTEQVVHAYDRVIDCFPDTISARIARERLAELQ